MRNFNGAFTLTSVILSSNVFILSPTLAAENLPINPLEKNFLNNSKNPIAIPLVSQLSNSSELPLISFQTTSKNQENANQEIDNLYGNNPPPELENIINVNQLQDITPDHWAYQALVNLVERYRCLNDFNNGKFNGNRAINRYEFAATLNSCLMRITGMIEGFSTKLARQEDLTVIKRLQSEFQQDLEAIRGKVDNLEGRVAIVQENRFNPITILRGTVNFNIASAFGDKKSVLPGSKPREKINDNMIMSGRAVINLDTSFTGKDRLRTQLVAGNNNSLGYSITGTNMTLLSGATNTNNNIKLGTLFYEFPIGNRGTVAIAPVADFPTRIFPALNPVNSISNFGAESPIYAFTFGSGAIAYYRFTDEIAAGITYLTTTSNNPQQGVFKDQYALLSQISYTASDKFAFGFNYGHYYSPQPSATISVTGGKGSQFTEYPFGENTPTSAHAFGLQVTYKLTKKLILGGWGTYFNAIAEGSPKISGLNGVRGSKADIWSWAVTAALTDIGKTGSQLNFVFGMPPKLINNDVVSRRDRDTALHFELSYDYPITEKITITPGFLMITNPEHNSANDNVWIGLVRTSFSF